MPYSETQKAELSKLRGKAASYISDNDQRSQYMSEQGDIEAKHGGTAPDSEYERMRRNAEDTIATQGAKQDAHARSQVNSQSYKHGTDRVPKTGPAILHKDEAVLNKKDAEKYRAAKGIFDHVSGSLAGDHRNPKELKHIVTRKAGKGYIHEHHFTHTEDHPMAEHVSADQDAMVSHMLEHMGSPNPGEAEADAGQSGVSGAV